MSETGAPVVDALNVANTGGTQPALATSMKEGDDGQMHYFDAAGKQGALAPDNIQKDDSEPTSVKPAFDPNAPVDATPVAKSKPAFDPNGPIQPAEQKPAFDPKGPIDAAPSAPADTDPLRGAAQATGIGPRRNESDPGMAGIAHWLEDLQDDVKNGTSLTKIGALLHRMGAKGTSAGVPEPVGTAMAGPALGVPKILHSITQQGTHPIKSANELIEGAGQTMGPLMVTQPEALPFLVAAAPAQQAASKVATAVGADEDTAELVGNVAGLLAGSRSVHVAPDRIEGFGQAVDNRISAGKVHEARVKEVDLAQQQLSDAAAKTRAAVEAEAQGTGTKEQTIIAQDNQSAAAANAAKSQKALQLADDARAKAAVAVQQAGRRITSGIPKPKPVVTPEEVAASNKELMETIPPGPGKSAYTPEEMATARPYIDRYHSKVESVDSVKGVHDSLDHAQKSIETEIEPHVKTYANEPLLLSNDKNGAPMSVKQQLVEALAEDEKVRPGFTEDALKVLEEFNATDPSVGEADKIRKALNDDMREALNTGDGRDAASARATDPDFAARYELADILRDGEYNRFEEKGVKNIRQKRLDERAVIKVRNAARRQIVKGGTVQRGSSETGLARKIAGQVVHRGAQALGAAGGAALGGYEGAALGGYAGSKVGEVAKRIIAPEDVTRDARIKRTMNKTAGDGRVLQIDASRAQPSNPEATEGESFNERYTKAQRPAPVVDPHENTPLHGDLATHFGETMGETPYADLEKQFLADVADKKKYKVPLEAAEKTLLQKINAQKVQEAITARKVASKKAARVVKPAVTAPEGGEATFHTGIEGPSPEPVAAPVVPSEEISGGGINVQGAATSKKVLPIEDQIRGLGNEIDTLKVKIKNGAGSPEEVQAAENMVSQYQERLQELRDTAAAQKNAKAQAIAAQLAESLKEELPPTDNTLHAELATHYGEPLVSTDATELENRFMSDLQEKTSQGVELEPAEKTLLAKVNKSKADARTAARAAAEEAAKVKQEAGQDPSTRPPFEAEPHRPLPEKWADKTTPERVATHDVSHALILAEKGLPIKDMISHEHDQIGKGALAETRWDDSKYLDENGNADPQKVMDNIDDILDILHAGTVGEDVVHGPRPEGHADLAAGDLAKADYWLRNSGADGQGFDPVEAARKKKASMLRVRQSLTKPGVPEMIKRYTQLREKGLDPKYLMSQEAIGGAVEEHTNAGGGGNGSDNESGVSGKVDKNVAKNDAGGKSTVPSGRAKKVGPASEAGTGAGEGTGRSGKLKTEAAPGVVEKSTGDEAADNAIKEGGGIPGGVMDFGEFGKVKMFHEPETGTTLGFKPNEEVTPEAVKAKIAKSRAEFGLKTEAKPTSTVKDEENLVGAPQKTLSLKDEQGKEIGTAMMRPSADGKNLQIEVSQLDPARRGEGLGKKMYTDAIAHAKKEGFETVTSDKHRTDDANHVWESLKKNGYPIEKVDGRYTVDLSKIGQVQPRDTFASAADHYGTTEDINKAGFIGPDGRMLDFSDGQQAKTLDHGDIATVTGEKDNPREKFQASSGSMRVLHSPRQNYVGLHFDIDHPPTDAQLDRVVPLLKDGTTAEADITSTDPSKTAEGSMNVGGHMAEATDADGLRRVVNDARANAARKIAVRQEPNLKTEANTDIQGELAKTRDESRADRRHEMAGGMVKAFQEPTNITPEYEAQRANERAGEPTPQIKPPVDQATKDATRAAVIKQARDEKFLADRDQREADFNQRRKDAAGGYDWADRAAREAKANGGGFSIDPRTGAIPSEGHMIEVSPESRRTLDHPATRDDLREFYQDHKDLFDKHPELHIGGYQNELDISTSAPNRAAAEAVAKKLDQRSIWDVKGQKEIDTGGEGQKTSFPDYPLEQRLADLKGENVDPYTKPMPMLKSTTRGTRGTPDSQIHHHELGHAITGEMDGFPSQGVISHRHALLTPGASAGALFDSTPQTIENLPSALKRMMAGGAANEVIDGVPRAENKGLYGDMHNARSLLTRLGFPEAEHEALINAAMDKAKEPLTNPGVADIIREAAKTREDNLPVEFHHSTNKIRSMVKRIKGVLNDTANATRGNAADELFGGNSAGNGQTAVGAGGQVVPGAEGVGAGQNAQGPVGEKLKPFKPPKNTYDVTIEHNDGTRENRTVQALNRRAVFDKLHKELADSGVQGGYEIGINKETKPTVGDPYTEPSLKTGTNEPLSAEESRRLGAKVIKGEATPEEYATYVGRGISYRPEPNLKTEANPEWNGQVSTRRPSGKNATEDPMTQDLRLDRSAINNAKGMPEKVADKIRKLPDVKIPENITDPQKIMDRFVDHVSKNLVKLFKQVAPEKVAANKEWYPSAQGIAQGLSDQHGTTLSQSAASIATLSPQKDWDMNVSLGKRTNDIFHNHADEPATQEMMDRGQQLATARAKSGKRKGELMNPALGPMLDSIRGKTLDEQPDDLHKAAWTRLYDEAHNPREYRRIDPATGAEGDVVMGDQGPAQVAWGTLKQISNSLSVLRDNSRENITAALGSSHKVPTFHNNIVDPLNPTNDPTIDTHAVAAAHMRVMSQKSPEVLQNFGGIGSKTTGMNGLYPLYAEGYRKAASELGVRPNQLQSVVWEEIRNMFPKEQKTAANKAAVDKMWADYKSGKKTLDETHESVFKYGQTMRELGEQSRADTAFKNSRKATSGRLFNEMIPEERAPENLSIEQKQRNAALASLNESLSTKRNFIEEANLKTEANPQAAGATYQTPAGWSKTGPAKAPGMVAPGNINLTTRPVVKNDDGSHSSEYSVSFEDDKGREVLVPTIVDGKFLTPDGKKPAPGSSEEKAMYHRAWVHYKQSGQHLGIFDTPEHADAVAKQIHSRSLAGK